MDASFHKKSRAFKARIKFMRTQRIVKKRRRKINERLLEAKEDQELRKAAIEKAQIQQKNGGDGSGAESEEDVSPMDQLLSMYGTSDSLSKNLLQLDSEESENEENRDNENSEIDADDGESEDEIDALSDQSDLEDNVAATHGLTDRESQENDENNSEDELVNLEEEEAKEYGSEQEMTTETETPTPEADKRHVGSSATQDSESPSGFRYWTRLRARTSGLSESEIMLIRSDSPGGSSNHSLPVSESLTDELKQTSKGKQLKHDGGTVQKGEADQNTVLEEDTANKDNDVAGDDSGVLEYQDMSGAPDLTDPFIRHLQTEVEPETGEKTDGKHRWPTQVLTWTQLGRLQVSCPEQRLPQPEDDEEVLLKHVRSALISHLPEANKQALARDASGALGLTPFQSELFAIINNYQDLYYNERTWRNADDIRLVYCLHALNHVLKSRALVEENDALHRRKKDGDTERRDQGFTRAKVLILLPYRQSVVKVMVALAALMFHPSKSNVANEDRFIAEFHSDDLRKTSKKDYEETFTGNIDDCFQIGVQVQRNQIRPYVGFYDADIIIASPMGLVRIITSKENKGSYDFLSSIEMMIVDQANVLLMQNWGHLLSVVTNLHRQPKQSHGADFSRVRMAALNGQLKRYCQLLVFSAVSNPIINSLFNKQGCSIAGQVRLANPTKTGSITQVSVQMPHVFHRFDTPNVQSTAEERFQAFVTSILPQYRESGLSHTIVFIPSYFDYVRVRNFLSKEDIGCAKICEYTDDKNVMKERASFADGSEDLLLLTERFYFFFRYKLRGACHLIFYELPVHAHFYSELCDLVLRAGRDKLREANFTCTVLYSSYDAQALAGVVGSERAALMLNSNKKLHMFVTGEK